jgi:hypothetical protein
MSERFGLDLKKAEALCAMAHPRMPSHFYHWCLLQDQVL